MSSSNKRNQSHAALKGIESKNGFLADETLLQFVQGQGFSDALKRYQNDRMRSYRDQYREFDRKLSKLKDNEKSNLLKQELIKDWYGITKRYFGYQDFHPASVPHWDGEGTLPYLRSENGTHSVALLFSGEVSMAFDVETSGFSITTESGQCTYKSNKKETLSEQVDRLIKISGCAEAVLFLPHSAYYFRSESQTAGQYLEFRLSEILLTDNDPALALVSHILSSDFFAYQQSEASQDEAESEDTETGGDDENSASGDTRVQSTLSSTLFKDDLEQARKITEDLHSQVTLALEILINERLSMDPELKKKALTEKQNEEIAQQLFKDGLFVLYRILFILYAEARRFLPIENHQYASFYSMEHLRDWADKFVRFEKAGQSDSGGTYLWGAFYSLFNLLRQGVKLQGGEYVSAFNGQLFAPDQSPLFDEGPSLRDGAIAKVLMTLTRVGGTEHGRNLHFANLGVEQLGAVYEAMLAQKPVIIREESLWVPAHGGGVGLVSKKLADALGMHSFASDEERTGARSRTSKSKNAAKGSLDNYISKERPGFVPDRGTFVVAPLGGQKRQTASFYTPTKLAQFLVRRTLKPLVDGKSSREILSLRIVEPAVGSGGFLIACLRYLGVELLKAKKKENDIKLRGRDPNQEDLQKCKREILEKCIFAVDLNPLSLELCRTSLYLEALVRNQPLPFLHHRLKAGNSLIYADFLNQSRAVDDEGREFPSLFRIYPDSMKIDTKILSAWDSNQKAAGKAENSDSLNESIKSVRRTVEGEYRSNQLADWSDWALNKQQVVDTFLNYARSSILEFEQIQSQSDTVDSLDTRYRDYLARLPDLDRELVMAEEFEIDEALERQRRSALIREHGQKIYAQLVKNQRALTRLKALGNIWCSQWFWPIDSMKSYPTPSVFREIVDYLLDEATLERGKKIKQKLSKKAFDTLRVALKTAKRHRFFQWNVEFAQVFADKNSGSGFSAMISNPPWKVVGVKDKDVYPEFDPQFLAVKPSEKAKRLQRLSNLSPATTNVWYERSESTGRLGHLWREGILSPLGTSGKIDLAVLFTLASERILKKGGRTGLLVSRSAVFSNSGTAELRERFFGDWGLSEAVTFSNFLSIFEIHRQFEFVTLVGQPGKVTEAPQFVHGVADLNLLSGLEAALDSANNSKFQSPHLPIRLDLLSVRSLSRETLSIPSFSHQRQAEIARAIHEGSGDQKLYLSDIEANISQGINQSNGEKDGSIFERGNQKSNSKCIPLFRGKDIDRWKKIKPENFGLLGTESAFREREISRTRPLVAWRAISMSSNQRTMIVSTIPAGTYGTHNLYLIDTPTGSDALALMLGGLPCDFLMKMQGGANRTKAQIESLPLANYGSNYLKLALELYKGSTIDDIHRAKMDALMWLHYGFNQKSMDRNGLVWALDYQFDTLKRNSPEYIQLIIDSFDTYTSEISEHGFTAAPIFKMKAASLPFDRKTDVSRRPPKISKREKKLVG